jgi:hypothetical protein
MNTSLLIGRLFAGVYIAVGLGMLLRPAHYGKMLADFTKSPGSIYLGGIMALIVGLLVVMFHNLWAGGWVVVLTVFGWLALIKGCLILALPDLFVTKVSALMPTGKGLRVMGVAILVLGLVVGYLSCTQYGSPS